MTAPAQEVDVSTPVFVMLLVAWVLTGVVVSVVLGRRGHDSVGWFVTATLLGPLSLVIAADVVRHDEHLDVEPVGVADGRTKAEGISVLVGYDDSPDAQAVVSSVVELMGARLSRLTLARVLPFDEGPGEDAAARTELEAAARRYVGAPIDLEIIHGRPATALMEAASAGGYDLLAVGATGVAHSRVLGSTVGRLMHDRGIPVLMCAQADASGCGG
jgi:hypothetical protein